MTDLGKAFDRSLTEFTAMRQGANQFKVNFNELKELFGREKWLRENCLVAAVPGSSNDGTASMQHDDSFTALRREIERFAHVIFASTPSQREFWLGKKTCATVEQIEQDYGALKPCLHGSDAHSVEKVGVTHANRHCWLRGDLEFETLRQAVIEPEQRVWIGESSPSGPMPSEIIRSVAVDSASWLGTPSIELNSGLVAIIGARGSGKTALMDLLAAGSGGLSTTPSESSFLYRAAKDNLVNNARILLQWADCGFQRRKSLIPN